MRRVALLALLVVLAGCASTTPGVSTRTTVSCSDAVRSTVNPSGSIDPLSFPSRPQSLNDTTARQYVTSYERAYRHNGALTDETTNVSVSVGNVSVTTVGSAYEVRLWSRTSITRDDATATQVGDRVLVAYNVTSSTLVRADGTGSYPSTSAGIVVECS
jgi:hypothetical protein